VDEVIGVLPQRFIFLRSSRAATSFGGVGCMFVRQVDDDGCGELSMPERV